jgi:four helix bundle protein
MHAVKSHVELIVWQKSVALASKVYLATSRFPAAERAGLSPQMRRAALMIASHIADGAGRTARGEYIRFLDLARSSLAELETQLHITGRLQMLDAGLNLQDEVAEIRRLLALHIRKLREERVSGVNIKT